MKLYEVPPNTFVRLVEVNNEIIFKLIRIDGMYSFCVSSGGGVIHIKATAHVEIVDKPEDWHD